MLKLVKPAKELLPTVCEGIIEYQNDTTAFQVIHPVQKMINASQHNFDSYFKKVSDEEHGINLKPGHVPQTTFWILDEDNKYVGTIALRHGLTPVLEQSGGHIAYQIIPSRRNRGYVKEALKLCLNEARLMGLDNVLLTCKEENIASYKAMHAVMLEMGGNEVTMTFAEGHMNHRVWIATKEQHAGKSDK